MKILVLSDSHGEFNKMSELVKKENPDKIIFTGDCSKECIELSYVYEDIDFNIVKGNMDRGDYSTPNSEILDIFGYKTLITHGHLYGVKGGLNTLYSEAKKSECRIVIFGHTHRRYSNEIDGIMFFNPGAFIDGSYGLIFEKGGSINFIHRIY